MVGMSKQRTGVHGDDQLEAILATAKDVRRE